MRDEEAYQHLLKAERQDLIYTVLIIALVLGAIILPWSI